MRRYLILFAAATLLAGCGKTGNTVSSSGQAASLGSVSSSVTAPASPATAAAVAQSFGLIGRWALDCGQPASPDNEYGVYTAAPDGSVGLTYDGGPTIEPNTYTYTAARLVGADAIEIDGVLQEERPGADEGLGQRRWDRQGARRPGLVPRRRRAGLGVALPRLKSGCVIWACYARVG
jgi:hypothetical protein